MWKLFVCNGGPVFIWQTSLTKSSTGFVEGSTRPFVYNLLLLPGEVKSFNVRFTPVSNHSVSSLLIVRFVFAKSYYQLFT